MAQAVNYQVSAKLLAREDFISACGRRSFGEVFRLMRQHDGASQDRMSAPIEGLSQSRISRIMRDEDRVATLDLIERIIDGLHIPGRYVGLLPRPWETPQTPEPLTAVTPTVPTQTAPVEPVTSPGATQLAEELGVDTATVQRWVRRGSAPRIEEAAAGEVVAFYAHRSDTPKSIWLEKVLTARDRIEILTYASLFLPEDAPQAIEVIRHKAASGVRVRIGLGDPDSPEMALRGYEEGLGEAIPGRVRMALAYYRPLVGEPGIEFHLHRTTLYNTIMRFDDEMLINQHVYGTYGYRAPILHIRKTTTGDLFETYERSFDLAWGESYPYEPPAPVRPASPATRPTPGEAGAVAS